MIAQNLPTVGRVEHLSNLVVLVHISIQNIQFVIGQTKQIVYQLPLPTIKSLPKYQFLPNQVSTSYAKKVQITFFFWLPYYRCGILKSKKQDLCPKINILKGNHCILKIRRAPLRQKLVMILENKEVRKLK